MKRLKCRRGCIRRSFGKCSERTARFFLDIHNPVYLKSKARELNEFTRIVLFAAASCMALTLSWDYAIDPIHAHETIKFRLVGGLGLLGWALVSWRDVSRPSSRITGFLAVMLVEIMYIKALQHLDQGFVYGAGGFLYFFIFLPFVTLCQPLYIAVTMLLFMTLFPMAASSVLGMAVGFDWVIYNAYVWVGFFPILFIMVLLDYLHWQMHEYRTRVELHGIMDELTAIANRRHFLSEGQARLARSLADRQPVSMLFIDIDRFKSINDQYGHRIGDSVMCHLVSAVKPALRQNDLFARYGGDEFLILLPATTLADAAQIAERIRSEVARRVFEPGVSDISTLAVTVSIGLAVCTPGSRSTIDIDALIHDADIALYQAKQQGRNGVIPFRADTNNDTLATALSHAVN